MKRLVTSLCLLTPLIFGSLVGCLNTRYAPQPDNIYRVGDSITALSHVDILKQWTDREFSISVGVSERR